MLDQTKLFRVPLCIGHCHLCMEDLTFNLCSTIEQKFKEIYLKVNTLPIKVIAKDKEMDRINLGTIMNRA